MWRRKRSPATETAGRVPTQGFLRTLVHLSQRHLCLLPLLIVCVAILLHLVAFSLPPFLYPSHGNSLRELLDKADTLQAKIVRPSPVVSFAGYTVFDHNDWLDPRILGLSEIRRLTSGSGNAAFDPSMWNASFFHERDGSNVQPKHALPTNTWWQAWAIPPGVGPDASINQLPYVLAVVSKAEPAPSETATAQDRAGLEIRAPFPMLMRSAKSDIVGIQQSRGGEQSGLFVGIKLSDLSDFVQSHVIEDYGPLSVLKRWDISVFARDEKSVPIVTADKITATMRARILRGSAFVSFELPAGVTMKIAALPRNFQTQQKNSITKIELLTASFTGKASSCATLDGSSLTTDAVELQLSDRTQWVAVFDQEIDIKCVAGSEDAIESVGTLTQPLLVRIALLEFSQHPAVVSGTIVGANQLSSSEVARRRSRIRWKLLAHIRKTSSSVPKFVSTVNKHKDAAEALKKLFVHFPIRDQLEKLATTMGFNLTLINWNENEIISEITSSSPDLLIVPDGFVDSSDAAGVSPAFGSYIASTAVGAGAMSFLGIGGTRSGAMVRLFREVFGITLISRGRMVPSVDPRPKKVEEIEKTVPTNQDTTSFLANVLPKSMPASLPWPSNPESSIELIAPGAGGWPFNMYCKPPSIGSGALVGCDAAIMGMYFYGNSLIQWLGMDWAGGDEKQSGGWPRLLQRAIASAGCSNARRDNNRLCVKPKKVLLVWDYEAAQQKQMIDDLIDMTVDKTSKTSIMSLEKTLAFLKGVKRIETHNVDGEKFTDMPDEDSDTLRDGIFRHALMEPIGATVVTETGDVYGSLRYEYTAMALRRFKDHSLFPPSAMTTFNLLWSPYRTLVYMTPLHRSLEYTDTAAHFNLSSSTPSLETDRTSCVASILGPLCVRSFGSSPTCRFPPAIQEPNFEDEPQEKSKKPPLCKFLSDGTIDPASWDIQSEYARADMGSPIVLTHHKGGVPYFLSINLPMTAWDVKIKSSNGFYVSVLNKLATSPWKSAVRWAVSQDVTGTWRLDDKQWTKPSSADDLAVWVRMIHRYAQIILAAEAIGLRNEKATTLKWLKEALLIFFNNKFDNTVMLYDESWGGIVPCGCDRDKGKGYCVPSARLSYRDQGSSSLNAWLSAACPSLQDGANDAGAGLYHNHHALWGYVVFATAVVSKFDPMFPHQRVRLQTMKGVHRPKIHHIVTALIQDYSSPLSLDTKSSGMLRRFYPETRHKDWWRLHSYGSDLGDLGAMGVYQQSLTEAVFGYWAAALYADVMGDVELMRWENFLAGLEIVGGNMMWHLKEYSEWAPASLRYLGSLGKVGELAATFESQYGSEPYELYHEQILPLTFVSFDALEPGWALWLHERWLASCSTNQNLCRKAGADLGLLLLSMFTFDWEEKTGLDPMSVDHKNASDATALMDNAIWTVSNVPCFQFGSSDCGMHTLTNSIFWTAIAALWGGAPAALRRDDGNGRFQVY